MFTVLLYLIYFDNGLKKLKETTRYSNTRTVVRTGACPDHQLTNYFSTNYNMLHAATYCMNASYIITSDMLCLIE